MGKIHIGMSGWTYPGWRGGFYPKGLVQKKELEYASRQVTSIEVNGTFYSLQKPESFQRWYDETPEDFCFSIKAPQFITHVRRLKDIEEPLANFLASGLFRLKHKLGPILWQFPPHVTLKDDRFKKFLEMLPHNSDEASAIAKNHSSKLAGRVEVHPQTSFILRHAFEFRHPSFINAPFIELLRKHGVALVFAHAGEKSPYSEDLTTDFIYARMHGQSAECKEGYPLEMQAGWANRVLLWTQGKIPQDTVCVSMNPSLHHKRDAFIYYDTENKEQAPYDALHLIEKIEALSKKQNKSKVS